MKSSLLRIFIILAIGLLGVWRMHAQATLSVQGTIVQNSFTGGAAAIDDGQYDITFRLYTTDAGGTAIWSETQTISIVGGVYSALLGAVNPLNVPFDQAYFLGLTLPGGPEHTPRTQLTAAPYALSLLGQENKFPSTGMVQMGSVATGTDISTATSYTVGANDHVIYLDHTANQNVTLPAATAANAGRQLLLVNKEAVAKTLTASDYVDVTTGTTSTTIPANSVIELQSDGLVWRQTGGYVKPTAQAKVYVYCKHTNTQQVSNSVTTLNYNEISDAQNAFSGNNTFTAPRTGIYRVSGLCIYNGSGNSSFTFPGQLEIQFSGTCAMGVTNQLIGFLHLNPGSPVLNIGLFYGADVQMNAGQTLLIRSLQNLPFSLQTNGGVLTITEQ